MTAEMFAAEIADAIASMVSEVWVNGCSLAVRLPWGEFVEVEVITCEDGTPLACGEIDGVMSSHIFEPIKGESPADFATRIAAWPDSRAA